MMAILRCQEIIHSLRSNSRAKQARRKQLSGTAGNTPVCGDNACVLLTTTDIYKNGALKLLYVNALDKWDKIKIKRAAD